MCGKVNCVVFSDKSADAINLVPMLVKEYVVIFCVWCGEGGCVV